MKNKILQILALLFITITSCTKKDTDQPTSTSPKAFDTADYSEYITCKVGDFTYNTGNNLQYKTSVYAFKIGTTLYLTTSDGNFVAGNVSPMEINMQFKNFDTKIPKSYEVSGTYPTEILKLNHVDANNYDTNSGVITPQNNSIIVTKIENGYYWGTFGFTVYKTSNKTNTLLVSQGAFKFKI